MLLTRKELFYAAVIMNLRQLVNIVYEFPADETKFEQELNEAKNSLRKKRLLTESISEGTGLDFALIACLAFCSTPEKCEPIDFNNYHAAIYTVASAFMLIEQRSSEDLAVAWFEKREILDRYIASKESE